MNKYVLSVLVENESGVLSRVAGLFSRRGYNIESLTVGETQNPEISRMTIAIRGDYETLDQIKKQLRKLVSVMEITVLQPEQSVYRELALVKVEAKNDNRASIVEVVNTFRGKIVDMASENLTVEITGDSLKLSAFIDLMQTYGIKEIVRTGLTALERCEH